MAVSRIQKDLFNGMKAVSFTSINIQHGNINGFDLTIEKYTNSGHIIVLFTRFGYSVIRILTNNVGTPTPSVLVKNGEDNIQVTAEVVGNDTVVHITNTQNWNTYNGFVTNINKAYVSNVIYVN